MYTPPKPRGPSAFDAFTAAQSLPDHTPGGVRVIQRFASQNLPPSPQPKAVKGFTCTREISPTLEVCVTRPPAPSPRAPSVPPALARDSGGSQPPRRLTTCPTSGRNREDSS